MQDPKTPDAGGEVGGASPSAAAETANQLEEASPVTVEAEAPSLGGDAVAAAVEVTPAEEQVASDVSGATAEPVAEDMPAEEATTEEPSTYGMAVAENESAADEEPSAGTAVEEALGMSEEPAASTVDELADEAINQPAAGDGAAAETHEAAEIDEAAEGVAEVAEIGAENLADTPGDAAEFVGHTIPPTDLEQATGTAEESEAAPAFVESVSDTVDAKGTEEAPAAEEEAAEAAGVTEDSEPVASAATVAEPAATDRPQTHRVWSDEQAEAFRARLREVTATFVDKAAGVVIETVNTVAVAIRSRTRRTDRDVSRK
jgi:nicotinate-nucleotide--dimethylbenzimidazole phosphoribosyltransferase